MTLDEVQAAIDRWIRRFRDGYWPPLANLARLTEEVGELARELNHRFGPKAKKASEPPGSVAEELADILFVVGALANQLGISLADAFAGVLAKYEARDAGRWAPAEDGPPAPGTGEPEPDVKRFFLTDLPRPPRIGSWATATGAVGVKDLERVALLYDFYGPLLTDRQQELIRSYYLEDLSLAEIAGDRVSRQAVHDQLRRALRTLEDYERRLGLVAAYQRRQAALEAVADHLEKARRLLPAGVAAAGPLAAARSLVEELLRSERGEEEG